MMKSIKALSALLQLLWKCFQAIPRRIVLWFKHRRKADDLEHKFATSGFDLGDVVYDHQGDFDEGDEDSYYGDVERYTKNQLLEDAHNSIKVTSFYLDQPQFKIEFAKWWHQWVKRTAV